MHPAPDPSLAATPPAPLKRKIAAILAADVAGYSRLVAENEERTLRDLAGAREIFDAFVSRSGGRIFNTAGDSVMCEFDSAVEAVRVAIDIQDNLRARSAGTPAGRRLQFRIGITIGDVVERGGDLLGDGVNIAARLEAMAPVGGICVSRSVHEAVANKIAVAFKDIGARSMKNIPQPIYAYVITPPPEPVPADAPAPILGAPDLRPPSRVRQAGRMAPPFAIGLVCGALALAGSGAWMMRGMIMPVFMPAPSPESGRPNGRADTRQTATPAEAPAARQAAAAMTAKPPVRVVAAGAPAEARPEAAKPEAAKAAAPERAVPPADPAAAFAALAKEGLVADPRSLPDLYHNARLLEAKGDRAGALSAYAALAPLAGDAVDPLLRYAALLRGRGGSAEAARRTFAELLRAAPSRAAALAAADTAEPAGRRTALEAYVAANPEVAPANAILAEDYLSGPAGPTLTERRLAFDQLDTFLDAPDRGRFFVDRALLDSWIETARRRRGEIEAFFAGADARPRARFTRSDAGWIARLTLPEPATAVVARIGEAGDVIAAATDAKGDARAAKAGSDALVVLPAATRRTTLYVGYRDAAGREAGPFPIPFDPASALVSAERDTLERYPDSWVSFRPDLPDLLSYAQLISNRCAITRALIGYGDEAPRQSLALPACDGANPGAIPAETRALLALPAGTDSVQVQLAYADGTESQVRTFRRP